MNNKKVIIGGTFDILHNGHKALLERAFALGRVSIGLVSDAMAKRIKKRKVADFKERKKELKRFIKKNFKAEANIFKIKDKFGPTLEESFDFIVVSPETRQTALKINKKRLELGKKPIKIIKIDFVLTEGKKPISSTKIAKGEIDREGESLKEKTRILKNIKTFG